MTHMLKKQSNMGRTPPSSSSPGGALGLNRDSRMISKVQPPKIRIIHIFAPEIIKTDVANFRELVQRLTGKPDNSGKPTKKSKRAPPEAEPERMIGCDRPTMVNTKLEVMNIGGSPSSSSDHHHHQTAWRSSSSSSGDQNHNNHNASGGGYLTAFTDLDFDFNTVWPADHDCPSHLNAFVENTQHSFRGGFMKSMRSGQL
ncbi:hypothetical protein Cgig2_012167 [Carnegiea gigantea]|uniref:VQ domain-containing protein n=1 Tax=Carnegiea gigantea TaxID=171969 RepID=A0A9Q1KS15_9CARY|nr:hypothetical protein Cgig2_012167 [Carnegiea gigantea]